MQEKVGHTTVLLNEAVDALVVDPDGLYIDGTFGRGGHSALLLQRLSPQGYLIAIDKDPEACSAAREQFSDERRFEIIRGSFAELADIAAIRGKTGQVQGILLDLGVSSPQLDDAERGFSFLRDGPLDMRMDPDAGIDASAWIAGASESEIAGVLRDYGEERFARRMARAIVAERARTPITRTKQLAKIIAEANPAWEKGKHPATRAFQAIRIYINRELEELQTFLDSVIDVLTVGGRLVVISFHSLEDRMVKRFMRDQSRGKPLPRGLPVQEKDLQRRLKLVGQPHRARGAEVVENVRSRSAIMRVAEKVD